jgi:hypothetical protein
LSFEPARTYSLFISYSHKDERLRKKLATHLTLLRREGLINDWHDRRIGPGGEWADEIDNRLREADIILLLVSAEFLDSNYCYEKEAAMAMERYEAHEARVIPIILKPCDWERSPLSKFQALPAEARPVTKWPNRDDAFLSVVHGIRSVIEGLRGGSPHADIRQVSPQDAGDYVAPHLARLCDRSEQDREVSTALRRHLSATPQRPCICIVHGDEFEDHGGFLDRMKENIIPQVLNLNASQVAVKECLLPWPENVTAGRDFNRALLAHMGWSLRGNSAATRAEVVERIAAQEQPLLFNSDLVTEDLEEGGPGLLASFIKFWDEWDDLPVGRTLISCVLIKRRRGEGLGFWRRRRLRRANNRLRKYVPGLDLSEYTGVSAIVVPELRSIRRSDVEAWIRDERVRRFFTFQEKDVRSLYSETTLLGADGRIPMEFLIDRLQSMMRKVNNSLYVG